MISELQSFLCEQGIVHETSIPHITNGYLLFVIGALIL